MVLSQQLLLHRQGALQDAPRLAEISQVPVGDAELAQGVREIDVLRPDRSLLDRQGPLGQVAGRLVRTLVQLRLRQDRERGRRLGALRPVHRDLRRELLLEDLHLGS